MHSLTGTLDYHKITKGNVFGQMVNQVVCTYIEYLLMDDTLDQDLTVLYCMPDLGYSRDYLDYLDSVDNRALFDKLLLGILTYNDTGLYQHAIRTRRHLDLLSFSHLHT